MEKADKIDLRVLETSKSLIKKVDQAKHQEMERKKVLVLKENQALETEPSRDGEKKSFGFKGKSSFSKKKESRPSGFTNNPKYFGKKSSNDSSSDQEKKSFGFKGKKKFKSRNSRPKNFSFKKTQ